MTRRHRAPARDQDDRWAARPGWARLLRTVIRLGPVSMAALVSWVLSSVLPVDGGPHRGAAVTVVVVTSVVVGVLTERLARRLLPLAALLSLTMLFPDRAPSRWKVARAARSTSPASGGADELLGARSMALLAELTAHDRRTRGHAERVRVFAEMLGEELHLGRDDQDRLRWAALLHDVGKIEVARSLLNKPGKPTAREWQQLQAHPAAGARLAGPLVEWLGEWGSGIAEHHERVDGSGYPSGLAGTDISRAGRALAVVDAYEVMTAARSYKKPLNVGKARQELARCAGSHFDPVMVRAFLAISLPRLLWTTGPLSFLANLPFLAGLQAASRAIPLATAPAAAAGVLAAGAVVAGAPAIAASPTPSHPQFHAPVGRATLVQAAPITAATRAGEPASHHTTAPTASGGPRVFSTPPAAAPTSSTAPARPAPVETTTPAPAPAHVPPGKAKKEPKPVRSSKVPPGQAKKGSKPPKNK